MRRRDLLKSAAVLPALTRLNLAAVATADHPICFPQAPRDRLKQGLFDIARNSRFWRQHPTRRGSRFNSQSIAESIRNLADRNAPKGVQVWLETHSDFVAAGETAAVVTQCSSPSIRMGEEVASGIGGRYHRGAPFCEAVCQGIREWLSTKRCE